MDTLYIIMLIVGVIGLAITEFKLYKQERKYKEKEDKNE